MLKIIKNWINCELLTISINNYVFFKTKNFENLTEFNDDSEIKSEYKHFSINWNIGNIGVNFM